ncbi:isoleucine-tRNA ligase [Coemansia sp. RSA 520]|nr:isoleucine-tRNA ligase [Coemansia sp. RSA 520]
MQIVSNFTNADLSAFYFDISKDCLYVGAADDLQRRSTQTALFHILVDYTTALAPVACHLAEEVWEFFGPTRRALGKTTDSVFQESWDQTRSEWNNPELAADWTALRKLRSVANRSIEAARTARHIGSSLEAELDVYVPLNTRLGQLLTKYSKWQTCDHNNVLWAKYVLTFCFAFWEPCVESELCKVCITSKVNVHEVGGVETDGFACEERIAAFDTETPVRVVSRRSSLHKCPRCWNFHSTEESSLCGRCDDVVARQQ